MAGWTSPVRFRGRAWAAVGKGGGACSGPAPRGVSVAAVPVPHGPQVAVEPPMQSSGGVRGLPSRPPPVPSCPSGDAVGCEAAHVAAGAPELSPGRGHPDLASSRWAWQWMLPLERARRTRQRPPQGQLQQALSSLETTTCPRRTPARRPRRPRPGHLPVSRFPCPGPLPVSEVTHAGLRP